MKGQVPGPRQDPGWVEIEMGRAMARDENFPFKEVSSVGFLIKLETLILFEIHMITNHV